MKNNRTIIATCIVAIFASGPAFAKDSWQFHEDDWSKVRSYAKVTVSQDSVESWGAWTDFVEPAAGAPNVNPAQLLGAGSGDSYRNLPSTTNPPVDSGICGAGDWCGYSIFTESKSGENAPSLFKPENGPRQQFSGGLFALTLSTPDGAPGEGNVFWRLASPVTGSELANSGSDMWANFGGGDLSPEVWDTRKVLRWVNGRLRLVTETYLKYSEGQQWNNTDNSLAHFISYEGKSSGSYGYINGFSHNGKANEATSAIEPTFFFLLSDKPFTDTLKTADQQVAVGEYSRTVWAYTSGQDNELYVYDGETSSTTTHGFYVAGVATPLAYLDAQKAGDVVAKYSGGSFDGNRQGHVAITVNFKPGTWTGVWYGGLDNNAINFKANGEVVGANIVSNAISPMALVNASNVSYSGTVQGSFYGQQAGSIGGLTNVSKSVNNQLAQTQNAVFLVNKVSSSGGRD